MTTLTAPPIDLHQRTLGNGLRIVVHTRREAPVVAVHLWYHVGSRHEEPGAHGFAHMFEHMMFRGTDRLGPQAHFEAIRSTGGECNAYTAFDQTVYVQELPANQVELALWLESERMAFLRIDPEGYATERNVVFEEYGRIVEAPYGTVAERLLPQLLPDHPYSWLPIGSMEHLRQRTTNDLRGFWSRYYVPANATLVVAGDVEPEEVFTLAEKYFAWIPGGAPSPRGETPPPPAGPRRIEIDSQNGPAPIALITYRTVPEGHDDQFPLEMLATLLGGGESSRLYRTLVLEKKRALHALSGSFHLELDGWIGVAAVLKPLRRTAPALRALREEVARWIDEGPTERELEKAKNSALRDLISERFSVSELARALGQAAVIEGDPSLVNERIEAIAALTIDDLRRVAREYLVPERETEVVIRPSALRFVWQQIRQRLGKTSPAPEMPAAETEDPSSNSGSPFGKPGVVRPADLAEEPPIAAPMVARALPQLERATLSSGLRVGILTDRRLPYVTVHLGIPRGAATEEVPGTASLASQLLSTGTANRNDLEIADELETRAITFAPSVTFDATSVSMGCVTGHHATAFELLGELVRTPSFPEGRFRTAVAQLQTAKKIAERDPGYLADRTLQRSIFGTHPYARSTEGERADLSRLDRGMLAEWWSSRAHLEGAHFYIAGDLDANDALPLAEAAFDGWGSGGVTPPPPPPEESASDVRILIVDRAVDQAQLRVGHLSVPEADPRRPRLQVVNQVFGGGFESRLMTRVRVELGLTYGIGGGFRGLLHGGELRVSTFTRVDKVRESLEAILDEVRRLREEPPTDDEIERAKQYLLGNFYLERETPESLLADHWHGELLGLPEDYVARHLEEIRTCTSDTIATDLEALVHPERVTVVVVGPWKRLHGELSRLGRVERVAE